MVEHLPYKQGVTGSNPVSPTMIFDVWWKQVRLSAAHAAVAQSVEQRTENPRVGGSIPPCGTT